MSESTIKAAREIELKPCPMCGSKAVVDHDKHNHWYVCCVNCLVATSTRYGQDDAIADWNTRLDAAQKVADEQTADLRNRLEAAESLIKSLTYFQVRDSTEIVEIFEGVWKIHRPEFTEVEFGTAPEAFQALKEL